MCLDSETTNILSRLLRQGLLMIGPNPKLSDDHDFDAHAEELFKWAVVWAVVVRHVASPQSLSATLVGRQPPGLYTP